MTWQPIETAPKDGTVILVWGQNGPSVVSWRQVFRWGESWWCFADGEDAYTDQEQQLDADGVTHWQPIERPE